MQLLDGILPYMVNVDSFVSCHEVVSIFLERSSIMINIVAFDSFSFVLMPIFHRLHFTKVTK